MDIWIGEGLHYEKVKRNGSNGFQGASVQDGNCVISNQALSISTQATLELCKECDSTTNMYTILDINA